MINPTGYTALDLVGFTDKGTYASNVNYVKNDIVHYGGNLWRCKIDDTMNVTPAEGESWTVFVGEPTNLVERIIAPLEENPATIAYTTGRQIIYDDWLWEVIDDIAVGDLLIDYAVDPTNANIKKAVPVETQLLDIKAKVGPLASLATTIKTSIVAAINEIAGKIGDLSSLGTTDKTSAVNAINEVNAKVSKTEVLISDSGDAYDPTRPYKKGELCIYNNKLYKCTTACSAGSWATNQNCFTQDTLASAITRVSEYEGITITPTSSNKLNDTLYAYRIGRVCFLMFNGFKGLTLRTSNDLGIVLPNYFKPIVRTVISLEFNNEAYRLSINPDGSVTVYPYTGITNMENIIHYVTYIN